MNLLWKVQTKLERINRITLLGSLRTFVKKCSNIDFFLNILPLKADELVMSKLQKNEVTDFVLEKTCPEEHQNLRKSGFVSEEDHSGCKSQNIAIKV